MELFDEVSGLILRFEEEPTVIDSMFENIDEFAVFASVIDAHDGQHLDKMNSFIALSESHGFENLEVALQDPDSAEIFLEDPGLLKIASESPEYFDSLKKGPVDLSEVPSELALQLQDLQLAPEELHLVLADLIKGPAVDAPTSAPPDDSGADLSANVGLLSLIQDHQLVDTFDLELVVSSELAMASSFFEETIGAYDALSSLDPEEDEYEDDYTEEDDHSQDDESFGVLGGSKISIGTGDYDFPVWIAIVY